MMTERSDRNDEEQDPKEWAKLSAEILLQDAHEATVYTRNMRTIHCVRSETIKMPNR